MGRALCSKPYQLWMCPWLHSAAVAYTRPMVGKRLSSRVHTPLHECSRWRGLERVVGKTHSAVVVLPQGCVERQGYQATDGPARVACMEAARLDHGVEMRRVSPNGEGVKKRRCAALCLRCMITSRVSEAQQKWFSDEDTTVDGPHPTVQGCPAPPRRRQRGSRISVPGGGEVFCPTAPWLATAHIGSDRRMKEVAGSHSAPANAPRQRRRTPPNGLPPPPLVWVFRGMPRRRRPPGHPPATNWVACPVPPVLL